MSRGRPLRRAPTELTSTESEPAQRSALERFVRAGGRRYAAGPFQVALELHDGFALNQPLSAFALATLQMLDPQAPGYALDVVSVIEATLQDPRQVLMAQRFEARGEAVAAMKADGMDYQERMDALEDLTWPRPLAGELEGALRVYRQRHPWVDPRDLSPKSVVRELYERCMTFGEFVAHHKLFRAEGVVLRYLTDAYRALRSTVPTSARTEELEDIIEWLGELVRHTDSSLLDEWEALANPTDQPGTEVGVPSENRALSANPRALRVMARQSMFRRDRAAVTAPVCRPGGARRRALRTGMGICREWLPRRVRRAGHRTRGARAGALPCRRGRRRVAPGPDPRRPRGRPRLAHHRRPRPASHR